MPSKINLYPYFFRKREALFLRIFLRGCCVLVHGHFRPRDYQGIEKSRFLFQLSVSKKGMEF
jgi:hypothetical protein